MRTAGEASLRSRSSHLPLFTSLHLLLLQKPFSRHQSAFSPRSPKDYESPSKMSQNIQRFPDPYLTISIRFYKSEVCIVVALGTAKGAKVNRNGGRTSHPSDLPLLMENAYCCLLGLFLRLGSESARRDEMLGLAEEGRCERMLASFQPRD